MAHYKYNFTTVYHDEPFFAARLAVLWPILGREVIDDDSGQLMALGHLLAYWRDRIYELTNAGWDKLVTETVQANGKVTTEIDKKKLQYYANCKPCMSGFTRLEGGEDGTTCKLRDLCPWCYARRISKLFSSTLKHLQPNDGLVYARLSYDKKFDHDPCESELEKLLSRYQSRTSKLATANAETSRGICWTVSLSPNEYNNHAVIVNSSVLAIVPDQEEFSLIPADWTTKQYKPPITQDNIVEAVSKAFRYPSGLIRGSADLAVRILKTREGKRLAGSQGCFWGK